MSLSTLAILLGCGFAAPQIYGLLKPEEFRAKARAFPRSTNTGYVLMTLATVWFLWHVKQENIADFTPYKPLMYAGFGLLGLGACVYLKDFLAVRGLALLLLLTAKLVLDTQRWHDSHWRLFLAGWAYLWILAGMWFTISPWRMRDLLDWKTATDQRIKIGCRVRLALGLLVVLLGFTAFK